MVKKADEMVNIELRPHDLRRHADLSTTQRYLGKVNGTEAIRWIETLYGESHAVNMTTASSSGAFSGLIQT